MHWPPADERVGAVVGTTEFAVRTVVDDELDVGTSQTTGGFTKPEPRGWPRRNRWARCGCGTTGSRGTTSRGRTTCSTGPASMRSSLGLTAMVPACSTFRGRRGRSIRADPMLPATGGPVRLRSRSTGTRGRATYRLWPGVESTSGAGGGVEFQVWNEANVATYWSGTPAQMAQLTCWTWEALHAVHSSAPLIGACVHHGLLPPTR
jgi:hypothetical protein